MSKQLLEAALSAIITCEHDARYRVDLLSWHNGRPGRVCDVCLAGAYAAKVLGFPPDKYFSLTGDAVSPFSDEVTADLRQLDDYARGPGVATSYGDQWKRDMMALKASL